MVSINQPAISNPDTMLNFPNVRNAERNALIDCVTLTHGMRILDLQAAGGYLSDEIFLRMEGNIQCICIEPSRLLNQRISKNHSVINEPVEAFPSVEDQSIDIIFGLAGLHHSNSHLATLKECFRVLKPTGQLAICDVIEHSQIADWLNSFVNRFNPAGHQGRFVNKELTRQYILQAGFSNVQATVKSVPWVFENRYDIAIYFKGLFGLVLEIDAIDSVLEDYFKLYKKPAKNNESSQTCIAWNLLYFIADKA